MTITTAPRDPHHDTIRDILLPALMGRFAPDIAAVIADGLAIMTMAGARAAAREINAQRHGHDRLH